MADEIEEEESQRELPSHSENQPENEEPGTRERITELESLLTQKDTAQTEIKGRFADLEKVVSDKEEEIATLKQERQELEGKTTVLNDSLSEAIASYKEMVVQANPEVINELIDGDTIESINESLEKAKNLVSKVREGMETEISLAKVPAGSPERTSPDLSTLSPREKIQYAIGDRK